MCKLFLLSLACLFVTQLVAQNTYHEVTLPELMNKLEKDDSNTLILDVRSKGEYADTSSAYQQINIGRIKGAINIPLQDFRKDRSTVHLLDDYKEKDIYVVCSHSYRSRVVSNMLLDSGFTHVNNTRGGMTEFYRRYDELAPFKKDFYETTVNYKNIGPAQLYSQLSGNKPPLVISIGNAPRYYWDSLNLVFNKFFPSFKNAVSYDYRDSLQILDLARRENGPVVLYNTVNFGAAELAKWLTEKGITDVSHLVGNAALFYEYLVDKDLTKNANGFVSNNSNINFITPSYYCQKLSKSGDTKIIDVRHDTMFNRVTEGAKYNYKHLKGATNYFASKGTGDFEKQFPEKKAEYVLVSENGIDGLEFADALTKKGYRIDYLIGGLHRWEWYMNNVETFGCMDYLIK